MKTDSASSNQVYFGRLLPQLDTRYVVLTGNLSLVVISMLFFFLQRSFTQIGWTLLAATLTEWVLFSNMQKYPNQSFMDRWPSALAEGASCLVLCRSKVLWVHPFMVIIAILSKYLIRKNSRDHVFNPANFAIIMTLCFLSPVFYEFRVDDYSAGMYPLIHVLAIGLLATTLANVWRVSVGYFIAMLVCTLFLFPYKDMNGWIHAMGPELGTSSFIFALLMITDPKSAPRGPLAQILFGFVIGAVHLFLRHQEFAYSRFMALFFTTSAFYLFGLFGQGFRDWRSLEGVRAIQDEVQA